MLEEKYYIEDGFVCPKCKLRGKIVWARYKKGCTRPEKIGVKCTCGYRYEREVLIDCSWKILAPDGQSIPVFKGGLMTPK